MQCLSTGICLLTGSELKIKQFDSATLNPFAIDGICELIAFKVGNDFTVSFKPVECGSAGE